MAMSEEVIQRWLDKYKKVKAKKDAASNSKVSPAATKSGSATANPAMTEGQMAWCSHLESAVSAALSAREARAETDANPHLLPEEQEAIRIANYGSMVTPKPSTHRGVEALKNWHQRLGDLCRYRFKFGHCEFMECYASAMFLSVF